MAGIKRSLLCLLFFGCWAAGALNNQCPKVIADNLGLTDLDDTTWDRVLSVGFSREREAEEMTKWKRIEDRINGSQGGPTDNGQVFEFALSSSLPEQERKKLYTAFDNKPQEGRFLVYRPSKPFVWIQQDPSSKGSLREVGTTFFYDERGRSLLYNLRTDFIYGKGLVQTVSVPLRFDDHSCGLAPEWKNFCEAFVRGDFSLEGLRNGSGGNLKRDIEVFKNAIEMQDENCRKLSGVFLWEPTGDSIIKATTALKRGFNLEAFRKVSSGQLKCQCRSNGQLVGEIGASKSSCENGVESSSKDLEAASGGLGLGSNFLTTFRKIPLKSELGHFCWNQIQRPSIRGAGAKPLNHRDSQPTAR